MKQYSTLVADPPWDTKAGRALGAEGFGSSGSDRARDLEYQSMSVAEICALPVEEIAEENAHLYLWTTNGFLEDAFSVARAWGFEFSTLRSWCKKPMGGGLGGAYGISTEYVLFCRRGKDIAHGRISGTAFHHKRPYRNGAPWHSAKPPEFLDEVEQVSPGPYVELFSRAEVPRLGWDYWGDESLGTAELPQLHPEDHQPKEAAA